MSQHVMHATLTVLVCVVYGVVCSVSGGMFCKKSVGMCGLCSFSLMGVKFDLRCTIVAIFSLEGKHDIE